MRIHKHGTEKYFIELTLGDAERISAFLKEQIEAAGESTKTYSQPISQAEYHGTTTNVAHGAVTFVIVDGKI